MARPHFCWQMYSEAWSRPKNTTRDPDYGRAIPSVPNDLQTEVSRKLLGGRRSLITEGGTNLIFGLFSVPHGTVLVTVIKLWLLPSRLVIPTTDSTALEGGGETTRKEQFNVSQSNGYSDNSMDWQGHQMELKTNITILTFLSQSTSSWHAAQNIDQKIVCISTLHPAILYLVAWN